MIRLRPQLAFLAALSLLASTGCRQQKPPTVVPEPPRIEAFTISQASLAAPGPVRLTWSTTAATRVELTRAGREPLGVPEDRLSGSVEVQVDRSSIFVLVARGEGGSEARAVSVSLSGENAALTLVALPITVAGGDTTTLAWTAPGATSVTLMAGTTPVDTRGQITSGAVVVRPDQDTTWTLSDGTRTATASVTVEVALLSVTATPPAAQVGEDLTISWTTAGADRVVVASPGRGQLEEITNPARLAAGSFTDVVPVLPSNGLVTYDVTAFKGTASMTRSLTVFVGSDLAIVRFDAPAVARAGGQYSVRWTTVAASRVQVRVEGQTLYESPTTQLAAQGLFSFVAPTGDFQVELVALNDRGDRITQSEQVDSVGVPTAATLVASPTTVAVGDPVTLTFTAAEARQVRITDSLGNAVFSVLGQSAESGTATVYPITSTTFTVAADNLLGDPAVTAAAAVTVTGVAPTVRQYPPTAISGQMAELRPSVPGSLLYGFPHQAVLSSAAANFFDISATGARVLEMGANVTSVTLPFSTMLWGEPREGALTISRAGWIAWGGTLSVNSTETALPGTGTTAYPGIIAPFWDDLQLNAASAVLVEVVGDAPEQRLIVQWNKVTVGSDADTELTFQVQVHQAGLVSFHYLTMIYDAAPTYTVGLQNVTRELGFDELTTAPPQSNTALYFFSPLSVAPQARLVGKNRWGGFIKTGTSYSAVSSPAVTVRVPFDVGLSELMFRPAPTVTAGQYVEAINHTATAYDLGGWVLRSGDGTSFSVPDGTMLPANGPLVIGASTDRASNDDAGVTVSWEGSGFSLGFDAGSLNLGTADAGYGLVFSGPSDGGTGASWEIDPGPFVSTGAGTPVFASCWASASFGAQVPTQRGSPGQVPGCGFPYLRQSITNQFHDISSTGTVVFAPATTVVNQFASVTLAQAAEPAPRLWGVAAPVVTVNSNGWLSPRTITVTGSTNRGTPVPTSEPAGTIAPFWDALELLANVSAVHWQRFEPGDDPLTPARHWIIQWTRMNTAASAVTTPDELTFQAKLFEDGTIEFHYLTMRSGTSSMYGEGGSATVWIEEPSGARALIHSYNTRAQRENTAIRFVAR